MHYFISIWFSIKIILFLHILKKEKENYFRPLYNIILLSYYILFSLTLTTFCFVFHSLTVLLFLLFFFFFNNYSIDGVGTHIDKRKFFCSKEKQYMSREIPIQLGSNLIATPYIIVHHYYFLSVSFTLFYWYSLQ